MVSLDREDESTALQAIFCSYPKHSSYVDLDSFCQKHKIFCKYALNCFLDFMQSYYNTCCISDVSPEHILGFVSYLFNKGKAPSLITAYLAELTYFFQMSNISEMLNHFLIKNMLSEAKHLASFSDVRQPITRETFSNSASCSNFELP